MFLFVLIYPQDDRNEGEFFLAFFPSITTSYLWHVAHLIEHHGYLYILSGCSFLITSFTSGWQKYKNV